jgi:phosphoribosylformylglycinamidine synthase
VTHSFQITVRRKPGLSDPEGTTTQKALRDLGFDTVNSVSFGRIISVSLDATDADQARTLVEDMCSRLLANPVIESYEIIGTT